MDDLVAGRGDEMKRLSDVELQKVEENLRRLVAGDPMRVVIEGHRFLIHVVNVNAEPELTPGLGPRPRYLLACETCERLLHESTRLPIANIERHLNKAPSTTD